MTITKCLGGREGEPETVDNGSCHQPIALHATCHSYRLHVALSRNATNRKWSLSFFLGNDKKIYRQNSWCFKISIVLFSLSLTLRVLSSIEVAFSVTIIALESFNITNKPTISLAAEEEAQN